MWRTVNTHVDGYDDDDNDYGDAEYDGDDDGDDEYDDGDDEYDGDDDDDGGGVRTNSAQHLPPVTHTLTHCKGLANTHTHTHTTHIQTDINNEYKHSVW